MNRKIVEILSFVTILSAIILSNPLVSAEDSSVDNVVFNVPVSCTIEKNGEGSHHSSVTNGTYQANIGTTTIKTICNDTEGFSIYAIGFTGDQYTGEDHTKLVGASSGQKITTGTAQSGSTSNWAMKLATNGGATYPITLDNSFDDYHIVPDAYTKVAHRDSGTDTGTNAVGATLTTTYAVYISGSQVADIYTGKVKYMLVHPASESPIVLQPQTTDAGKICYYANANTVEGTMGCQTVSASDTTAKLFASNFSRAGYGFAGWSDAYDYATNSNANFYGPNETIGFTAGTYTGSNPGLSLYAVWVKSQGDFQDSAGTIAACNSLTAASVNGTRTLASVSALTDTRDNQTYAIAKLADDKCWMIENLRLDNTAQLSTLNTNNPLNDGTNVTLKHNYTDTQTYNTLSASTTKAYNADTAPEGWCTTNSAACDDQSRLRADNTATRVTYASTDTMSTSDKIYLYGNYYNWYSATAGRGTYGFSTVNSSTAGDLCPLGWRLPKSGNKVRIESDDDSDFWYLVVDVLNGDTVPANYSSSNTPYYTGSEEAGPIDAILRTYPNNFVHTGFINGSSITSRGSRSSHWSSTVNTSSGAFYFYFYSSYVYPGTGGSNKYYGRSIRCIASIGV